MTDVFLQTVSQLIAAGIESPRLEARMMIAFVCGVEVDSIGENAELTLTQNQELNNILHRRLNHEPLDKILGYRDFYKYRFIVSCNVLTPRPDSEILVEETIKIARNCRYDKILELGVGSGCLILSVLSEIPQMQAVGTDKSAAALEIAAKNAENMGLSNRVKLLQADYFADLPFLEKFPLIISNPPYIPTSDIDKLDEEVAKYDPKMALDGGEDGYEHYRRIAEIIPFILENDGFLLLEVGQNQADTVAEIFINKNLILIDKIPDLSGIERCVVFQNRANR